MINLKFYLILCGILFVNNKILGQLDTIWTKVLGGSQNEVNGLTLANNLGSPGASISKYRY
jgi:hypothetical protein